MSDTQTELHNRLAGEIVKYIVRPVVMSGGGMPDVMVLLESVIVGVMLATVRDGSEAELLDAMSSGVCKRVWAIRLAGLPAGGSS